MNNIYSGLYKLQNKLFNPLVCAVRNFERRKYLRRFGYESPISEIGLLPRIANDPKPIKSIPVYKPVNRWAEKRALFGTNDYIDILCDGSIKPTDSMRGVPSWLRGFQGNEYQMLLLKRQQFYHWKVLKPKKYDDLQKRIRFLYRRLNHKTPT